jgi:lysine 6-dehydrogenase
MGYAVIYDLVRSPNVDNVFVADRDIDRINKITDRFADDRLVPCQLDARNLDDVARVMTGCDVAISCMPYDHNFDLARAALEDGVSFCDLGGNSDIVRKELLLDEFARKEGVTIVPDCGLAPGLVSILAAAAAEGMEEIYEMRLRVGGLPVEPQPPLNYSLTFSVDGLINEYVENAHVVMDGKLLTMPSLTNLEEIHFPEPFGALEAFTTSGGVSTLPSTFEGKVNHLDYKTIRYPGHCAVIKAMRDLGLMDSEQMQVDSVSVAPRKVLSTVLESKLPKDEPDVVLLRVTVTGVRNEKPTQIVWEGIDYMDQAEGLTAMMRMTAFPASIIAQMIARGDIKEKGALVLEKCVPTGLFLAEIASRGIRLSMLEKEPVA